MRRAACVVATTLLRFQGNRLHKSDVGTNSLTTFHLLGSYEPYNGAKEQCNECQKYPKMDL